MPIRTSVTAKEAIKKFVGCLICRSTTKETSTSRLPNVVMTMQMARLMAMRMVVVVSNGAGQHSGPQGVPKVPFREHKKSKSIMAQCDKKRAERR